ncbi:hypothetical protein LOD99_5732 [Oopsacas minuta]|uniref:EGF-like domain-containing protein n=1 Tax=Oopsacas minuta TaxID=111878 RepID=A0AAV7JPW8_9METZ|nr:hypothetical protein LOD99_5732 [Oopsacas minuta]
MRLLICIFALYIAIQTTKCNCPNSCGTNRTKICPIDASYRCVDGCEYCFCEPGSKYSSKLNKCVDINECSVEELVDLCTFDRPSDPGLCGENYTCTLSFINCSTASNPVCGNSNCKNLDGGYVCYCPDNLILIEGENGYTCQQVVCENGELVGSDNKCHPNPCHDNKCMGNGKCEFIDPPKFYCRCDTGYSGENCGNKKCPDEIEMFFEDEVEERREDWGSSTN